MEFLHLYTAPPMEMLARARPNWTDRDRVKLFESLDAGRLRVIDHMRAEGLWEDTSPSERQLFEQPVKDITIQQRNVGSWRIESVLCLAWALGLSHAIPGYDTTSEPGAVLALLPTETAGFVGSARLRSSEEISDARDIAELWNWRNRTRYLQEKGYRPPPGQPPLDAIVREAAVRCAEDGTIAQVIDGDFPALGKAYRDLSAAEWRLVGSITEERHFALNWLCGYAPGNEWDETPTST